MLGREGLALFRTPTAEVPRFRALARALYAGGAGETARRLIKRLYGINGATENEDKRVARIVDNFLRAFTPEAGK